MPKTKKEKSGAMDMIVSMAKAGKSEKEITQAVKSNYGQPSNSLLYIIGREWRRVNKVGRHFGTGDKKKTAPKSKRKEQGHPPRKKAKATSRQPRKLPLPPPRPSPKRETFRQWWHHLFYRHESLMPRSKRLAENLIFC